MMPVSDFGLPPLMDFCVKEPGNISPNAGVARPPVMLVEDDPNDVFFTQFAWAEVNVPNALVVCENGADAIQYFSGSGPYLDRKAHPLPCALLTDLKMPKVDGFELLSWLQGRREFKKMPKIVLSSSGEDQDRDRALALGATEYLVKPLSVPERSDLIRLLAKKWLKQRAG